MNVCCLPKPFAPNGSLASHFVSDKTMCFFAGQEVRKDLKETWACLGKLPFEFFSDCSADLWGSTIYNYLLSRGRRYLCGQWFYHLVVHPYHSKKTQTSAIHLSQKCLDHRIKDTLGDLGLCNAAPIQPKNCKLGFANYVQSVRDFFDLHELRTILSNICLYPDPCVWQLLETQCHKQGTHGLSWEVR